MYPYAYHQEQNFDNVVKVMNHYPLATLISVQGEECLITHLPLLYVPQENSLGKLIGHIDKNNPQSALLEDKKIQVIFNAPDAYISPKDYTTEQLPTWNYIKIHLKGVVNTMKTADELRNLFVKTTQRLETTENPFILTHDHVKMNQLLKFIIGFEIEITDWEGKFKLSQDKIPQDMANAKQKLINTAQSEIAEFIESIYENHQNSAYPKKTTT